MAKAWEYGLIAALIAGGLFMANRVIEDEPPVQTESEMVSPSTEDSLGDTQNLTADEYYDQGLDLYYGDTDAEELKGIDFLKRAHELGHDGAAEVIGGYYQYQKKDMELATAWYQKGVERGDGAAMTELAHLYKRGKFYEKDPAKAFALYKQAADMGHDGGLYNVGVFYKNGSVVEKDIPKAISFFERAHEEGYQKAGDLIARMYEKGDGVPVDNDKAYKWYLLGSEAGWAWSYSKLGDIHSQGQLGQAVNNSKAYGWYLLAKDEGWSSAVDQGEAGIAKLAPLLSPAQIKEAKQKAADCAEYILKHCELQ